MKNTVTYLKTAMGIAVFFLVLMAGKLSAQDGKTLFKQNCGVCHTTTQQKLVGPGLEGIGSKRSEEWLIKWIKDSQALVKSGDADAKAALDAGGGVVMPPFAQLSDDDVKAILAFIATPAETAAPAADAAAGATVSAAPKAAPLSMGVKLFIASVIFILIVIGGYIMMMKRKLQAMGYAMDTEPFGDRVSKFVDQNGRFLLIIAILVILAVMKSCVSHLM